MSSTTPDVADLMDVERRHAGRRDRSGLQIEVRERWGLSETRWAQLVNATLTEGSAFEVDPMTAGVLSRRIQRRQKRRSAVP